MITAQENKNDFFQNRFQTRLRTLSSDQSFKINEEHQLDIDNFIHTERAEVIYSKTINQALVQVCVSPSKMTAFLNFFCNEKSDPLPILDLNILLYCAGIVHGVTEKSIRPHIKQGQLVETVIGIPIAFGTESIKGTSGSIKLLKQPYKSQNSGDLANFDFIQAGERIAEVIPPIPSIPGMNVFGEFFRLFKSEMDHIELNRNIKRVHEDLSQFMVATTSGYIIYERNKLSLLEDFNIKGDVTVHRGSFLFENNVHIHGDIEDNVSCRIGKNLDITGMVGAADLQVEGNLNIQKGIFGKNHSQLLVSQKIQAKYINETKLTALKGVSATKEIIHSFIYTLDRIDAETASIVGGQTFAYEGLQAEILGSKLGIPGLVVAGLDHKLYRVIHELEPKVEKLEEQIKIVEERLHRKPNKKEYAEQIEEIKNEKEQVLGEIEYLKREAKPISTEFAIRVNQELHPGVKIMIGEHEFDNKDLIRGPIKITVESKQIKIKNG